MAAKPPAKPKPARRATATIPTISAIRLNRFEQRLAHIEARLDRMADALAPALAAWRNIRRRIPAWILSMGETREQTPDSGEE